MTNFFEKSILKQIKSNETDPIRIDKFISRDYCKKLLDYKKSITKKMVDREESTKVSFNWNDSAILKDLKEKIKNIIGSFEVKDFEPHFITTRFPLRLHADTGKDPNDLIFKNVVIPLEINYQNNNKRKSHTVVFKNKWYDQSALFTTKTANNYDFIIKDNDGNFVDILNINDFKKNVDDCKNDKVLIYNKNKFLISKKFKEYVDMLSNTKRYNMRTNAHITNNQKFNLEDYKKYMSHQPYEDCTSLIIDKVLEWEVGSLFSWDRVRIHSSDNFLINGIESKTCIAVFTSK